MGYLKCKSPGRMGSVSSRFAAAQVKFLVTVK